jgi:AcrR family transcriptional regulator
VYAYGVPKLWTETIEEHRRAVGDAILDTTATLVAEHGLGSVTMSQIATETGIGRATLYKYFPDVEAILAAWHQRHVAAHLAQLAEVRDRASGATGKLDAVLHAYAFITYRRPRGTEIAATVHRGDGLALAQQQLRDLIRDLLVEAARTGHVRDDIAPDELTAFCLHALGAAAGMPSPAAVTRLVDITSAGLRPSISSRPAPSGAPTRTTSDALAADA